MGIPTDPPTSRTIDYGALVKKALGDEYHKHEIVYQFSGKRKFESSDYGTQGIYRAPTAVNYSGTAQAVTAHNVTLDAAATGGPEDYVGHTITLTDSVGTTQSRTIVGYNDVTKVAAVVPAWIDLPSAVPTSGLEARFCFNSGITVTGSGVSSWADRSGNARDLLQATNTNRPALQSDGSILFDGVDDYLKCASFTLDQPETVYILFKQVTWTLNDVILDGDTSGAMYLYQSASTPQIRAFAGSGTPPNSNLSVDTWAAVVAVYNGASSLTQINSTTPVTGDVGAANAGGFTLGADAAPALYGNIHVKEVLLYSIAHDADTRAAVVAYLAGVNSIGNTPTYSISPTVA